MRGRYLWQKLELLLSFYLLAPLWAALVWVLQQVGSGGRPGGGTRWRAGRRDEARCPLAFLMESGIGPNSPAVSVPDRRSWASQPRRPHHWPVA